MAKRTRKSAKTTSKLQDYTIVAFAKTEEEAKEYQSLLRNSEIPAVIKKQTHNEDTGAAFAVMVPEDCADEAYVIVESLDSYDDFYDDSFDEDGDDFDDIFDDNY